MTIRVGIVGFGEIARNAHVAAIGATPEVELVAVATRSDIYCPYPRFTTLRAMIEEFDVDAITLCVPPSVRYELAMEALEAGKHVLLEKPPATSMSQVDSLRAKASQARRVIFASWHSRFAPAIPILRKRLSVDVPEQIRIDWLENVRVWHPEQRWIWQAGGFGVFDPEINALSILTLVLRQPPILTSARLEVPSNAETPIAALLGMKSGTCSIEARFDWRHETESWNIEVRTARHRYSMALGGAQLSIDGTPVPLEPSAEYAQIYRRFAALIATGISDMDATPLALVENAISMGSRITVEPFYERKRPAEAVQLS